MPKQNNQPKFKPQLGEKSTKSFRTPSKQASLVAKVVLDYKAEQSIPSGYYISIYMQISTSTTYAILSRAVRAGALNKLHNGYILTESGINYFERIIQDYKVEQALKKERSDEN